jgi:hypothetical protein
MNYVFERSEGHLLVETQPLLVNRQSSQSQNRIEMDLGLRFRMR